jgi:uncharacterized protein (TIGR02301 family)
MVRVFLSVLILALAAAGSAAPVSAQDLFRNIFGPRPIAPPQQQPPAQQPPPQQRSAPARPAPEPKQVKIIETPPAYEGEMGRLAEILGALHYLRPLCGTKDGSRWRNEMSGLIEAEQPPAERRDRLIASFNRSYTAYEQTYRSCTPAAELAIRRFLDEGAKLSREIATRYGN